MDKVFNRKNSIALLIPAIVGNAVMLVLNVRENGGFGVGFPIILLSLVYLSMLRQIDESKKFQQYRGIIVMIPVVVGCAYSLVGAVKLRRNFSKI